MRDESTSLYSATVITLVTEDFTLDELAVLPFEAFCDLLKEKGNVALKIQKKCQIDSTCNCRELSVR